MEESDLLPVYAALLAHRMSLARLAFRRRARQPTGHNQLATSVRDERCARSRTRISRGERAGRSKWSDLKVNERATSSPFRAIRAINYTVIFVRDMAAMRSFYEGVLGFPLLRELSPGWVEYRIGDNTLALARPSRTAGDAPTPTGSASLQLAFKVARHEVDQCADELMRQGVVPLSPPTDQAFGHRTLFFRDPDGNLLEVYAEI
jgi:catechol 2,3-dioxygenase-like lactoylglutathione lyase family enzyme